jgi:quinol monooxygenase YgiN
MARVWTHGTWVAKPGQEDAFVKTWSELARQAMKEFRGQPPILLRDREMPNVFKTFGAWPDIEAVDEFRSSNTFRNAVAELQPLLESFEPMTLDEVEWR